jgi:hypothetical protein
MVRCRPPDHVPPELLARPDFVSACAERDLGAMFRIVIKWGGAGFTASHLARRCEMGVSRVQDYAKDRKQAHSIEVFERVADGLHIPGHMLGISSRPWEKDDGRTELPGDRVITNSQHDWIRTRQLLNQHRPKLTQIALDLYPESMRLGRTGILMPSAWRLEAPLDLGTIDIELCSTPTPLVTGRHEETLPARPLASPGRHYESYHRAMRDLDRPRLFENRICYRLLDAKFPGSRGQLALGYMRYFDMIDVGEAAAHELALAVTDQDGNFNENHSLQERIPFRKFVGDPLDLAAYPLLLSISTLTVRRSRARTTFILLRRHVGQVAIAGGMLSVMPTGVFQPASIMPTHDSPDFNMWRNMMREYSEEFLGNPEHDGSGDPIDYAGQEPFRSLDAARSAGKIRVLSLGVGIDALNLVGDVFTVAVFDADVFDEIFHNLVETNEEGTVTNGNRNHEQFVFDGPTIDSLLTSEPMAPSGAACLSLAWQHRESVLG